MEKKILLAVDFDHTLIDENSDLWVKNLVKDEELPESVKALYSSTGWTEYMGAIFEHLHNTGITEEDIKTCMGEIPITEGMEELFRYCHEQQHEIIIVSDSNSVFIDMILKHAKMDNLVTQVFTNPAYFDDSGCLRLSYFHTQDWCDLSTVNMCKGRILQDYIEDRKQKGVNFDQVYYVGDGTNDFCPSLTLKENDYVCPRVEFRLWKKILKLQNAAQNGEKGNNYKEYNIKAKILPWNTGSDILTVIKENVSV